MLTSQIPTQSPAKVLRKISFIQPNPTDISLMDELAPDQFDVDSDGSVSTASMGYPNEDSIDLTVDPNSVKNVLPIDPVREVIRPSPVVDELINDYKMRYEYDELSPSDKLYAALVHLVTDMKEGYGKQAEEIRKGNQRAIQISEERKSEFERLKSGWERDYKDCMDKMKSQEEKLVKLKDEIGELVGRATKANDYLSKEDLQSKVEISQKELNEEVIKLKSEWLGSRSITDRVRLELELIVQNMPILLVIVVLGAVLKKLYS